MKPIGIKTVLFICLALTVVVSCKKDKQKPQTVPVVKTLTAVSSETSTAEFSGEVSDNGNTVITEAGFVYSSNVLQPTTADNKIKSTDVEGNFTVDVTGLSSGTKYYVRAYAINNIGTGYGEVIEFTTGNAAPVVTNVVIAGTAEVGKTLTAEYSYSDAENNPEGATTFQWYVANTSSGEGEGPLDGATEKTFIIQEEQNGKFLRVGVTPKAMEGTAEGTELKSGYTTAIGAETVTFTYNNAEVTYGTIVGPSGRKWLDRNLGASRVAENVSDYLAYGDLYQWGRLSDGHQLIQRTGTTDALATGVNTTTSTQSSTDMPGHNKFITDASIVGDWRNPQNPGLWQSADNINNPCPAGWRIPTLQEWANEGFTSLPDAYSKLKATFTGFRDPSGAILFSDLGGFYWASSTILDFGVNYSNNMFYATDGAYESYGNRANGHACRCIKAE